MVKYLAQGLCHDRDSNPHSADQKRQSLSHGMHDEDEDEDVDEDVDVKQAF